MEMKLGTHVCDIVSMTTTTTNSVRHFSLKLLLHSSNSLTVLRMEMKLGTHVCNIVSITITTTNSLRHFSLKLLLRSSNFLTASYMEMKHGMHIISVTTRHFFSIKIFIYRGLPLPQRLNEWRQVNYNPANLKNEAYKDGIKRKGDKIGMGYMKHG